MREFIYGVTALLAFTLCSCSGKTTTTLKYEDIHVHADAPLFEGSNTLQGDVETKFASRCEELGIEADKVSGAKLKSAKLYFEDSTGVGLCSSITIQFTSEKSDMVKVALINPVPADSSTLDMTVASEQPNLIDFLKEGKFTVVADAILAKDFDANLHTRVELEFELQYKK